VSARKTISHKNFKIIIQILKKTYTNCFVLDNKLNFRNANIVDVSKILEIYNFYIANHFSNFEEEPLKYNDFLDIYKNIQAANLPFIVCEQSNSLIGFSYLNKFRNKSGYKHTFEDTIYIEKNSIGRGVGFKLLNHLINTASKNKDIKTIIAVIGGKNPEGSIHIHKKNGFSMIGTLKSVGFKKNQWLDATYMQKILYEKN
jgi:L-amino acid N-acyltransferase YncA